MILTILLYLFANGLAKSCKTSNAIMVETKSNETKKKTGKPEWQAKTKGYEDCVFYMGKGMQDDFIKPSQELRDYIRK